MSPAAQSALDRLEEARQRWWIFSMLCNVLLVVTLSISTLVLFISADVLLQLSGGWLTCLFSAWSLLSVTLLAVTVFRVMKYQRSLEAAARRVELDLPDLGSHLINLIQLLGSSNGAPESFRQAAIAEAAARVQHVRFQQAAERHSRWSRWKLGLQTSRDVAEFSVILLMLVALTYALAVLVPKWSSSTQRLLAPWQFIPQVGRVQILEVTPGDTEVLTGSRLDVVATIANPGQRRPKAMLYVTSEGQEETARAMLPNESYQTYSLSFPAVLAPMRYRLQIGDSQSAVYRVGVREKPTVQDVQVRYEFPAYLQRPPLRVQQKHGDLEAPQYTLAHLNLRCSSTLSKGYVQLQQRKVAGRVGPDKQTLHVTLQLSDNSSYTVHLFNELGHTDTDPRVNTIRVSLDAPPSVHMVKPAQETSAAPGSELAVVIRAADDHGLGEVRLEWKLGGAETDPADSATPLQILQRWGPLAQTTATTLSHDMVLDTKLFQPGQLLLLRAVAVDRRQIRMPATTLQPQETASPWRLIRLIAAEEAASDKLARLENLTAKLWAILQSQIRARLQTAQILDQPQTSAAAEWATDVQRRQIQVQTDSAQLAETIDAQQGQEEATLKQALGKLAHGDMLRAARQADRLAAGGNLRWPELAPPLMDTQDRIIDVLRRLLAMTRRATSEVLAELKDRPGGDLPDDVQDQLEQLAQRLEEFLEQQKRVIQSTASLAKKPVEDFTEEEAQLLKQLAAAEDEWSRFMEQAHSDFSKLPEQDFANPSLLEELVEVQTELKMAADALTKKTADIAVPLEQLGAEMAEELLTNIEKWLPDTPDRERWSQEEPLSDDMKEAPMAELPGELEDLVGELMEEEEDLFDEMEDVSSSWADSLDKGAGWDAMDGPISNMSAKGVTGNRLPNTSEIGGRSGEGRQGKASGEFVADTAVGKGGRKTPTRLAPDPFVKGQVKDLSKDPVGGATGGGKESGMGGEGLEGPVPQQAQRELARLANKQADLRNRAETVDLKFQVLNYHHTDLKQLIEMMAAVERDLRSGRYQSALHRREVLLQGLDQIKTYLDGEFEIRRDHTSNLPEDIQKELLGSMQDVSPPGWEELNREYFQRLASGESAGGPAAESGGDQGATDANPQN